jgi:hypothetical protein
MEFHAVILEELIPCCNSFLCMAGIFFLLLLLLHSGIKQTASTGNTAREARTHFEQKEQ